MEESCIPSNIQWITHFLTNPKITNQNTIGSGICSVKAWTTIIWYLCRLVYPREISQATMMAGSSRWQSAVIGGNGAWRSRMRTMNPKSNRTCLYRRSDRGPVLRNHAAASRCATSRKQVPVDGSAILRRLITPSDGVCESCTSRAKSLLARLKCHFTDLANSPGVLPVPANNMHIHHR